MSLPASDPVRPSTTIQKTRTTYLVRRPHGSAAIRLALPGPGVGGELVLSAFTRSSPAGEPINGWAGERNVKYDVSRLAPRCQVISRVILPRLVIGSAVAGSRFAAGSAVVGSRFAAGSAVVGSRFAAGSAVAASTVAASPSAAGRSAAAPPPGGPNLRALG